MKGDADPMNAANSAPRCTATSKRTGERCKGPAVNGWTVCRFHGAGGGGRAGKANPAYKHGMRSKAWTEMRKEVNDLVRQQRALETLFDDED